MPRRPQPGARDQILDAAGALFYTRGVRAVGMSEVVEAAGCGKNLVYTHFPAKVDLVAAYLERFRSWRERAADEAVAGAADPAARILALTAEVARRAAAPDSRGCALRNYLTEFPDSDDAASRVAHDYLRDSRARLAALVDRLETADAAAVTDRIWLVLEGLYAVGTRRGVAGVGGTAVDLVKEIIERATPDFPPTQGSGQS